MRTPRRQIPGPDLRKQWGRFDADGRSFLVTSTDTPRPWCNVIANDRYGAFFSQHGLGFSFYHAPKICEVTRWSVNESRPSLFDAGRYVFVRDLASGQTWPINPQPGEGGRYRDYACRHGLGFSEIIALREGIAARFRFFVPLAGNCELWTVTLANRTNRPRRLAVVPSVELPTRATYIRAVGRFDRRLAAVRCHQPGDPGFHRMDSHLFLGLDRPVVGFDTSRAAFWGPRGQPREPAAVATGLTGSAGENEYLVAAVETRLTIPPGAERTFTVICGYAARDAEAAALLRRFRRPGAVAKAFDAVARDWQRHTGRAACELPDRNVARYLSVWGKQAVTVTTRFSRSQRTGVRDALQDLRGYLLVDPAAVREQLLWLMSYVRRDGSSLRSIDQVNNVRHDFDDFRDNPVWSAELVSALVRETGELALLDEPVAWLNGGRDTLWAHQMRIVGRLMKLRGEHGLTLVGGGDWNDALGPFGARGRGESAWLSLLMVRALRFLGDLARASGRKADATRLARWRADLIAAFNRTAWDGAWYVYGWDDDGVPLGSARSVEGKIYANVQTWALMEGVVPPRRQATLWRSIEKYLLTDAGLLAQWPAYRKTQPTGSRIAQLAPGTYENAAVYCHGTSFYMAAAAACGRGDDCLAAIAAALPTNPKNPKADAEPFATTNFYVGPDSQHFGRAPHSYFTGSAAWFLFVGWEGLLGIEPDFAGLRVHPCVPRAWTRWSATRRFRGGEYVFTFRKKRGSPGTALRRLTVDGRDLKGNLIPVLPPGRHEVAVELE